MLDDLTTAIEGLVIPAGGAGLEAAFGAADRLECHLVEAVWVFSDTREWSEEEGAASVAAWLRVRCGLTNPDAFRLARTARRLRRLPTTFQAWRDGTLTGGQIRVICAVVTDRLASAYASWEDRIIPRIAPLDAHQTAIVMKTWAARIKETLHDGSDGSDGSDGGDPDPDRTAHLSPTLDGTGRLDANLDPEGYQAALAALRLAMDGRPDPDDARSTEQRRHDALVAIFVHFLDHQNDHLGGRHRPHLNITIGLAALLAKTGHGQHLDGTTVTAEDARRLACDAGIHRVITRADGSILDYSRATRVVSAALFAVLCLRDQGCRYPGCDRPCHLTDAHHIHHWIDGGHTNPDNLVLLCRWHHHVVHRRDWTIQLLADTTVTVTSPDGRRRTSHPPGWLHHTLDVA